ncbi:MAG: sigma-E processing peptidase SpoIIGA [Clostridia bacterium]|nr:sigma-E processing peptidase SpoIIGA [Clostridia bacterium]
MERVIYGDVFFLINFSMDFLGLYLVRRLTHEKGRWHRESLAAVLGGLYALAALFLPPTVETVGTLLTPLLLVRIAFPYRSFSQLFKGSLLFFGISFALGGVMTAVYYAIGKLLSSQDIMLNGSPETVYSDLPLWLVALTALFAALFAFLWGKLSQKTLNTQTVAIAVSANGKTVTLTALCDSGNLLEEPLTRLPVIVLTKKAMEDILPHSLKHVFFHSILSADSISPRMMKKIRFIPTSGVTGETLLCGYIPDSVTVNGIEKTACLALDPSATDFEGTDAILPTILLG